MECGGYDCDDTDPNRYPGNHEICDDGHDEDCDSTTLGDLDADGDGFVSNACCNGDNCGPDCDDSRRDVFPGAPETCNAIDDDCNGIVDDPGAFCPTGTCTDQRCRALSWEWTYGTGSRDGVEGLAVDSVGNIYTLMSFIGPVDLNNDGVDEPGGMMLFSLSPDGRYRWGTQVSEYNSNGLALSPDGETLVTARGSALHWLSASDGTHRATHTLTSGGGWGELQIRSFAWSANHLFVASQVRNDDRDRGVLLTKMDAAGVELSRLIINSETSDQTPIALDANHSGAVLLALQTEDLLNLAGTTIAAGTSLIRFDASLTFQFHISMPNAVINYEWMSGDGVNDVALSNSGAIAAVGRYRDSTVAWAEPWDDLCAATTSCANGFVVSWGPDGSHRWSRQYRAGVYQFGPILSSVVFDERGGIVVAGTFVDTLDVRPRGLWSAEAGADGFFAVWDAIDKSVLQAHRISGPGLPEEARYVTVDPYGSAIVVGTFTNSVNLLLGSYPAEGETDTFLMRISD